MNLGLADAFDLGWKLTVFISKKGGRRIISSYEKDRHPGAIECIERSGVHSGVHRQAAILLGAENLTAQPNAQRSSDQKDLTQKHYQLNDGEDKDLRIEMGYRY
jgi:hypothetical protein